MKIEFNENSKFDGHLIVDRCEHGYQRMYIKPGTAFSMEYTAISYKTDNDFQMIRPTSCTHIDCKIPFVTYKLSGVDNEKL